MLETEIKKLTAAVEANTAARLAAPTTAVDVPVEVLPVRVEVPATVVEVPVDVPTTPAVDMSIDVTPPPSTAETPVAAVAQADLKQITEGIVALCRARGRETAAKLMAEYGAAKVPDLKKVSDKYGEILGKINALITG